MKYFEVTFTAQPCNETITDVLSGLTADIGFEVSWNVKTA